MTSNNAQQILILNRAKEFFKEVIIQNNLNKIDDSASKLSDYKINPFLIGYLSQLIGGEINSISISKSLLYPKILGTSITTSFGANIQVMMNRILGTSGSTTSGIDIEFIDTIDGRKKFCQLKAGPQTINKDDVTTIKNHFIAIRNLARTNSLDINPLTDLIVGVLYGTELELSANYKKINEDYNVYVGKDLWHRITGDEDFYNKLINAFTEAAIEMEPTTKLNQAVLKLSKEIEESPEFKFLLD